MTAVVCLFVCLSFGPSNHGQQFQVILNLALAPVSVGTECRAVCWTYMRNTTRRGRLLQSNIKVHEAVIKNDTLFHLRRVMGSNENPD